MAGFKVSDNFTRPADTAAYAAGDLVANSTTAGSVVPLDFYLDRAGGNGWHITGIKIAKSGTTPTNANFKAHFYGASPTCANGDNGAWSTNKVANYFGYIAVTAMDAFTDGCAGVNNVGEAGYIHVQPNELTNETIYCLLEAEAAYTPASAEVFTVTIEVHSENGH